jgi:hypothetical protein
MAGTITLTSHKSFGLVRRLVVDWVADAADASVPALALPAIEGYLLAIETNPGATAPTANYDIALNDAEGVDRLLAAGQNRHTTTSEIANVVHTSSSNHPGVSVDETLTLAISGNAVNSATGRVVILYAPGPA